MHVSSFLKKSTRVISQRIHSISIFTLDYERWNKRTDESPQRTGLYLTHTHVRMSTKNTEKDCLFHTLYFYILNYLASHHQYVKNTYLFGKKVDKCVIIAAPQSPPCM